MVVYAVYLTYKSEKLRRTIKTLSDLHITAANSLVTLGSSVKRNHILKLLQDEIANASKTDTSFFKAMELDLEDNHQA